MKLKTGSFFFFWNHQATVIWEQLDLEYKLNIRQFWSCSTVTRINCLKNQTPSSAEWHWHTPQTQCVGQVGFQEPVCLFHARQCPQENGEAIAAVAASSFCREPCRLFLPLWDWREKVPHLCYSPQWRWQLHSQNSAGLVTCVCAAGTGTVQNQ